MAGTSSSNHTKPLENSQTQGSHHCMDAAPERLASIQVVIALPLQLTSTSSNQNSNSMTRRQRAERINNAGGGAWLIRAF